MGQSTFKEIVGGASTTAYRHGRRLGRNVNACAYDRADGKVVVKLESNGTPCRGVSPLVMSGAAYDRFCQPEPTPLFVRGIELFGAEAAL